MIARGPWPRSGPLGPRQSPNPPATGADCGGPMRNSPRFGIEPNRPPLHAERPTVSVSKSPDASNSSVPGLSDRQERQFRAAGQVPERHAPVRAHCQHPAVAADRWSVIINRLAESMSKGSVLEGRIDLVRDQLVLERDDDPSVLAEFRAGSSPVKLSTGRPRTASQSRSRISQPLLATSVPAGWKATFRPLLVVPSRVALRVPVAGSQR